MDGPAGPKPLLPSLHSSVFDLSIHCIAFFDSADEHVVVVVVLDDHRRSIGFLERYSIGGGLCAASRSAWARSQDDDSVTGDDAFSNENRSRTGRAVTTNDEDDDDDDEARRRRQGVIIIIVVCGIVGRAGQGPFGRGKDRRVGGTPLRSVGRLRDLDPGCSSAATVVAHDDGPTTTTTTRRRRRSNDGP